MKLYFLPQKPSIVGKDNFDICKHIKKPPSTQEILSFKFTFDYMYLRVWAHGILMFVPIVKWEFPF
jgi:hypothetical protein